MKSYSGVAGTLGRLAECLSSHEGATWGDELDQEESVLSSLVRKAVYAPWIMQCLGPLLEQHKKHPCPSNLVHLALLGVAYGFGAHSLQWLKALLTSKGVDRESRVKWLGPWVATPGQKASTENATLAPFTFSHITLGRGVDSDSLLG